MVKTIGVVVTKRDNMAAMGALNRDKIICDVSLDVSALYDMPLENTRMALDLIVRQAVDSALRTIERENIKPTKDDGASKRVIMKYKGLGNADD